MRYAEVCVNSPIAQRLTFTYDIPARLDIKSGQAVWVPFGEKVLQGIVLALTDYSPVAETREIAGIIEPEPLLSPAQISLARWISRYYLSPIFDATALMLPPGFERRALTFISAAPAASNHDLSSLSQEQKYAFELVQKQDKISLKQLEKALGKKKAQTAISALVRMGLVTRSYELEPVKTRAKFQPYISLAVDIAKARQEADNLNRKRAYRQAALLEFIIQQARPVSLTEVREKTKCDRTVVDALVSRGLAAVENVRIRRDPLYAEAIVSSEPPTLTTAQESALKAIQSGLRHLNAKPAFPDVFLLHGVTGSGKTEVYLQALAEAVKLGKRGIVLVPEIALTPQTIERFAARFPGRVAVLHSQLSAGEQFDEWHRIRNGEADVVIGPRSALFAPQPDLGLIVMDEENEWTYKQHDKSPRYHARDIAIKLAGLSGAEVILGSATPDVESYYRTQRGKYHLLRLPERVTPSPKSPLPRVEIVDMREELKAGNRSMFSRTLSQAITRAVAYREQVILFLNRRGAATFIQCRDCGFVLNCRRCDIPLSYHIAENTLSCHQCNRRYPIPAQCPQCRSRRIKFLGTGTQKLEQEAGNTFSQARLLRWDSDATQGKNSHKEILNRFRAHEADILIGTQMVAKGLDLPRVTLVGVINADTGLNLPDFRAGERTFQLLSQVAGRAGRGAAGGKVIIQTYSPEHYAIQSASRHDYESFYEKEITYRRQLNNPPFTRLARFTYTHTNDSACQREAERMKKLLIEERDARGIDNFTVIGPAPAFIHRLRGRFRWQLILRNPDPGTVLSQIPIPRGWSVDIDPVGL